MRIVCISDTHGWRVEVPNGDVLIHCGDYTHRNSLKELPKFVEWMNSLPHKHKIFIPGNHDKCFEESYKKAMEVVGKSFTVLIDQEIEIEGVKFYGTPYQPIFFNWAFNIYKEKRRKKFSKIPKDTDVLITHTPPLGILDKVARGNVGCEVLKHCVEKVQPKYHIFGHIHESYGILYGKTNSINCSICNDSYYPDSNPLVFDMLSDEA